MLSSLPLGSPHRFNQERCVQQLYLAVIEYFLLFWCGDAGRISTYLAGLRWMSFPSFLSLPVWDGCPFPPWGSWTSIFHLWDWVMPCAWFVRWVYKKPIKSIWYMLLIFIVILYPFDFIGFYCVSNPSGRRLDWQSGGTGITPSFRSRDWLGDDAGGTSYWGPSF